MFYTAKIEIDPSQITVIKKIETESFWSKLMDVLTIKGNSSNVEQETFTVLSILNQIQMGLMRQGVDNVVKISVDNFDYFQDSHGKDHDLHEAMEKLEKTIEPIESERFNEINLVLEHKDEFLKYVIDIKIKRKHVVGEYPVVAKINGLINEFKIRDDESVEALRKRMAYVFTTQNDYDEQVKRHEEAFQRFVRDFEHNLSNFIKVDGIKLFVITKMMRPKELVLDHDFKVPNANEPVFCGYPGINEYMKYVMLWGIMCSDNQVLCNDFTLVDDHGSDIITFGKSGFNASDTAILNPKQDFDVPDTADSQAHSDNKYQEELSSLNLISIDEEAKKKDKGNTTTDFTDLNIEIID